MSSQYDDEPNTCELCGEALVYHRRYGWTCRYCDEDTPES